MFTLLGTGAMVWPAEPHIDRIEMLGTNRVTLHFDTAANTIYTLQYVDGLVGGANGMSSASWSNLTVLPATPFNNHYVLVDNRTNQHRFYRLSASPE
jgi:hypothetical protein